MGREAKCDLEFEGARSEGKAHLETDSVVFRGDVRLNIPFKAVSSADVVDNSLRLRWEGKEAVLHLGSQAGAWAWRILNPPGLLDKLGIKSGMFISLIGN